MDENNKEKPNGSKGFGQNDARDLARCGGCAGAGITSPSSSGCNKRCGGCAGAGIISPSSSGCNKIGTWNVRSLYQPGKLANVMQEMVRMEIDILGVAETFYEGEGEFNQELPECQDTFKIIYSGGKIKRRGVGVILRGDLCKTVLNYKLISDRIMLVRLQASPVNLLIVQLYASCEDQPQEVREQFYELVDQSIAEFRKGRECLVVMGDFNGKVGNNKEDDIV